ncbi:tRNA (32-2'-O)-methyltransferase regulator THADA-like [Drosophila sulfurigaster albostrigata]|uniref:tRNA (32-2'-O)-methyltransferase regulator THADA-like n=1 Tax=Drosophila sulfurigaster albostrigata TaxID=89887 RepID=UPI002D21A8CF|nr:tRNA (32-2'-O)-methyltransferase regulator THADA-like [Drosophila sulfurigaster albostrigata]
MNDLSLRVTALKLCAHPKLFAEMRSAPVRMPIKWQNSQEDYVQQFAAATTCNEQITVVKVIFGKAEAFAFLADLLFVCPLKHPVRGILKRLFSSNEVNKRNNAIHTKDAMLRVLRDALQQLAEQIADSNINIDTLNDVLVSVGACLHSFAFGRDALAKEIDAFIPLLPRVLRRYWTSISEATVELSPTRRNEFYLFIQNLLRFYVNFMVDLKQFLVPQQCEPLRLISELAASVARHLDTPWNVRSIAGLAIGHNARFFNDFDEYMRSCHAISAFEELPIKAASLLVLQKTDYVERAVQALEILKSIIDQVNAAGDVTNLLVYMSKHLHTYSKSLSCIVLQDRPLVIYNLILVLLLKFALQHIGSSVKSIRHMAASLLQQVLIHAKATGQTSIKQQVFAQLGREHIPLTSLCLIVQQLVEIMGTRDVLFHCPAVFQKIFLFYLGLDDNVNSLYKSMMTVAHKEENFKDWYNIWVVTLLRQAQPYNERFAVIERLIKSTVELDGQVLGELCQYKNLTLSTKLAAMSTARRHGQQQAVKQLLGELSIQINQAMMGFDDNTRLMALAFVVETPRLSEPFSQFEIDAIMCFLHHNCNTPNAHVRQIARGLLQKGFKRLELNLAQQLKEKGGAEQLQLQHQPHTHILSKFVNDLLTLLSLNLFPTANYGRRWISMQLIGDLLDLLERLRLQQFYQLPAIALTYLEHCLRDRYEDNKLLAAGILAKLQPCIQLKPLDIMQHLVSQRPPDSVTGAYQLQVYCQAHQVAVELPEELLQHVRELPEVQPRYYLVLQWCLRELRAGIAMAEVDLTQTARHNPMYGLLFASRHLLQQLKLTELAEEALWRQYINELLEASMGVSELMLTVVASESPEGHVPTAETAEEEQPEEEEQQAEEEEEEQVEDTDQAKAAAEAAAAAHTLTSQLVLLCAWRSIKEVSLITGELVHNAPLQQEQQQQKQPQHLLSQQQVAQIGEHFLLLLSEIKHRGAFEQAYEGFTLLCRRFWHSDEPALNQLPQQWLDEAMALVAGSEGAGGGGNKICPTRRSAGVPYMLQALICTELKLGTHNTFSRSMKLLLEVCERREPGSAASTARSHALNIMRALFRCSELSELVGEFIGRGVRCALESLVASEWAERNRATLLLSALIVRIFGVERARNEVGDLHLRNRMTGRIFFTRYPALFDYFHTMLGQAASRQFVQSTGGQTVQLEAMLQFLSRLYPSTLEGIENTLSLNEFVSFLQRICCVHDYMTRVRASQVLANFTSIKTAKERIAHILMVLNLKHFKHKPVRRLYAKDLNAVHGHLLQLLELYWIVWKDSKLMSAMLHTVAQLALTVFDEDIYLFNAALNVLIAILQDANDGMSINDKLLALLQRIYALDHATVYERCNSYTISPKFFEVYGLHLHRITQNADVILEHMVKTLIKPKEQQRPEMQQFAIDLFLHLLSDQANNVRCTRGIIDSFELKNFQFDPDALAYCKALGLKVRIELNVLTGQLRQRRELIDFALQLANDVVKERGHSPQLGSTVYTLLSLLGDELELPITELLERRNCDIEPGLVLCVTRQVMLENIRTLEGEEYQQFWLNILHYALDISDPKQKPYLRYKAAQLTDRIGIHIRQLFPTGNVQIVGNYIRLVLQLLVDESDLVRNCAAEMVANSCGESDQAVATFAMLPTTAEIYFLKHVLHSLKRFENDGTFLIGIFITAVEPFVSAEFLDGRFHKDEPEEKISETMEDSEVFDKQDPHIYCEGLRVASVICNNFRVVFGQNKELICAFDAIDKLTMCLCTNITPYIPQVST